MKFRPIRETLAEAMEEVREVETFEDVRKILEESTPGEEFDYLTCTYYGYDDRIGWDTWIVFNFRMPVGFTNGKLKENK